MSKPKIIFLGSFPPPYIGPSIATEVILKSRLKDEFELIHLDTSDHRDLDTLKRIDFTNIVLALKHYCMLLWLIVTRWPAIVYIPLSQTTPGYLRDAGFILIAKILRRKVICHLRGGNFKNWYDATGSFIRWFVRRIHSLVDGQIVLGETLRYLFDGIVPQGKIYVVPNGRDFNTSFDIKKHFNTKILFLSNFIRTKGVLEALRAVGIVFKNFPQIEAVFAGSWRDKCTKTEFESFVKENPHLPVVLEGPVYGEKKYELLASSDIFVFPTYYPPEGHPWVVVEAMGAGLPIISTDQGAITESVIDGVNGFIVEKQNPQQIAEKIKFLIENPEIRLKMGRESRRVYEASFTEEKMIQRLGDCFQKILNPYDVKMWYDALAEKWGKNYYLHDRHFMQRVKNIHQIVNKSTEKSAILDIGCASGEITVSLHERFRCNTFGVDISEKMVELCKKKYSHNNLHFEVGDMTNLRFRNNEFDLVVSSSVIEWIEDYEKAIAEVTRVLKHGGQWIVSLPNWTSPFRKAERLQKIFLKNNYLRYQKNQVPVSEFGRIASAYGFVKTESVFHVLPFYTSNLSGRLGPLFGMMCIMSMIKS